MAKVELFIQGGLGNQLLQRAYVSYLQEKQSCTVHINPILMSNIATRARGVAKRELSDLAFNESDTFLPLHEQLVGLARIAKGIARGRIIVDTTSKEKTKEILESSCRQGKVAPMMGYFHRAEALSVENNPYWTGLAKRVSEGTQALKPYPHGQIGLHIRLGDYTTKRNKAIYCQLGPAETIERAIWWRKRIDSSEKIMIVTDEPMLIRQIAERYEGVEISIKANGNPRKDFLEIARHRHILLSNSTFGLTAARLSVSMWGNQTEIMLPMRWYLDEKQERIFRDRMQEFCFFTQLRE